MSLMCSVCNGFEHIKCHFCKGTRRTFAAVYKTHLEEMFESHTYFPNESMAKMFYGEAFVQWPSEKNNRKSYCVTSTGVRLKISEPLFDY